MAKGTQNLIILSKLQAPQIKIKILLRKRLIDLLLENLDKKLILICAGAGYGKTTLLSQFLSETMIKNVYYHLEKSDAEPAVFLSYLITGIQNIQPKFGKKTKGLSHFFNYPKKYLELIAGTFINEIIQFIKKDLFIILEDYHLIDPPEPINRILSYMLEHLPANLHFIITSRTVPSISLTQLRARGEMIEIGSEELKFTKNEIKNLFKKIYSISLEESEIEWIDEHSEGWPTSLGLMLQSSNYIEGIKSSDYVRKFLESYHLSKSDLFNYFAQEIYNKEPKKIQNFLLDCSVLEWLSPAVCNTITNRRNSDSILSNLTTKNAFLFSTPDMGYRFHTLFRDFLCSKFTDINRKKRIYRKIGDFYVKTNSLEQAVKFFLEAEAHNKASAIIEKIGRDLTKQGKSGVLCSYIEAIPTSVRDRRPELLMSYAQSLTNIGRTEEAKLNCIMAVGLLKKESKNRKKYAEALYQLGGINLNQGNFEIARKWFIKALKACPKNSKLIKASILNSIGSAYNELGGKHLRNAIKYFEQALNIAQKNKYKELEASILNNWAWNDLKIGELNLAYSKLSKMVTILQKHFSFGGGRGFYNAARLSILLGKTKEARSVLDIGLQTCSPHNDPWSIAAIWHGYALVYKEMNDIERAKQFISKSLEVYEKLDLMVSIIAALNEMCKANIMGGDFNEAEKNISTIWWLKKNRFDAEAIPILLTEAELRIAQDKFKEAKSILLKTLKIAQKAKQFFDLFTIHLKLSEVSYFLGKTRRTISELKEAIMIAQNKGYDYLLLKELQKEKWILPLIKKEHINEKYIMSIVKNSQIDIHWIDAYLFGVPKLFIDDCEIKEGAWKTVNSKKLFFYLILHKNEKVSRDSLIDLFWQDASFSNGRHNLRKTIQYIRETIKSKVANVSGFIEVDRGLYQISSQVSIRLDVEEFQNIVNQLKQLKKEDENLKNLLQKAISLYKKGFAIGWYDKWVEDMCRHYDSVYEECLNMLAYFYFHKKKFKQAITWYKKLILLNLYDEEYHRKLMVAYGKLGKTEEIIKDFKKLKDMLKKELGSKPQQKTINLYKSLIR